MKKYKIDMPKDYKRWFTLEDMERIEEIKKMDDLQETIQTMIDVYAGQYSDVLRVELEFCKNGCEGFFFGYESNIDVLLTLYTIEGSEFYIRSATFSRINEIGLVMRDEVGYTQKFVRA